METQEAEASILEAFDQGKIEQCFQLIVSAYKEPLYWHIRKIVVDHDDADDAIQSTYINVWKNLEKFKRESKLSTWIYRIATNEALQIIRKRKPNIPLDDVVLGEIEKGPSSISEEEGDALEQLLQKAILQLPNKQRLVFNMKYFDDMKYEEISDILGTSVGALKASYHLATKKIEEYLNQD